MKTKRVLYPLLLFILALILTVTPAGTAMGWGNGEGNLSSYGAHDWIVSQAYELAGGSAGAPWLILSTALASCDDPDYMSNKVDAYHNYHPLVSPPDTMPTPYPHGGAHDQVRIGYDQILAAIAAGQRSAASKAFGILAHYYADVCQPMHTDEALSEGWTHSRYEMAVDRYTRSASYNRSWVIPDGLQPVLGSEAASAKTVEAATAAHPHYRTLVSTYAGSGMNTTVLNITKASLNNAANGLADILAGLTLSVPGANAAPAARADATPTSGKPPLDVQFDSTGSSDPDGTIVSYLWDFGDGSTSSEPNPSHTYTTTGTRTARLTVTDDGGATGTATVTIKLLANQPPKAVIGTDSTSGKPPLDVQFDSTGSSDPDGTIVSYLWDFGDGSTSSEADPSHTYASAGTYTAKLTVTDDNGATGTTTVTIKAVNQPPKAVIGANPASGVPPLPVAFSSAGSSDPDGTIVSYLWDFGDGSTSSEPNPSHTYTTTGTRTAKLTVTDDNGATGTTTVTIKALPVMRVQSISMSVSGFWYYRTVRGSVLVTDANGAPITNATVRATWSGTTSGAATATTGTNGVATFSKSFWAAGGQVTLTVTDVTKTGCAYDAGLNLETQDGVSF